MASQGPPVPFATKPTYIRTFSTVGDAVTSPKGSSGILLPVSLGGLDALQNVLESVNTLPCIKYITGITIKLLQIVQEVQSTNEAVRKIAMRAKDIVLAVARACANALEEVTGQLESNLQQLTETMNDILEFTQEISTRRTYQKLWNKAEDAAAVKSLDAQLSHAFQIFEIQSSVNLRLTQQIMVRQLSGISLSPPTRPPLSTTHPLRIPDGLYLIQNAANGRAVETEHWRPSPSYLHACVAPSKDGLSPYQIWFVSAKQHKETDYTIRNFATGASLDVYCGHTQDGTQVICQASHGMANQTWSLYGSRAADSYDYCTIRSHGPPTILDGECPAGTRCDYLHVTSLRDSHSPRLSQEWSLIRVPLPGVPYASLSHVPPAFSIGLLPDMILPRRRFVLQNIASGSYATVTPNNNRGPNVLLQSEFKAASTWYFQHVVQDNGRGDDMFALVTGSGAGLCTLDAFAGRHVAANAGRCNLTNAHHMWKALPRNGGFVFRNLATGTLLAQPAAPRALVHFGDPVQATEPACQWRLLDPATGAPCPLLYDSALAVPPPELAAVLTGSAQPQECPQELVLRTAEATPTVRRLFAEGLKREHDTIREMLGAGYTSLVLAPRLITAWKSGGGLRDIIFKDEEDVFGQKRFQGKRNFDTCHPR